jgi:cobalt-zinc-cadmium efflux system outer membrane protein
MRSPSCLSAAVAVLVALLIAAPASAEPAAATTTTTTAEEAEEAEALPSPLRVVDVIRIARERRAEVMAARARASAAMQRPHIVGALPDPMVAFSADHVPFNLAGVNARVTVQQEFPLSRIRGYRERAAELDATRVAADVRRVALDVSLDAVDAFFTLAERKAVEQILDEQVTLLDQIVAIARAHYASGQILQSDVYRLENEAARLRSERQAITAEIRGAAAMLNVALGRPPDAVLPTLAEGDQTAEPPALSALLADALRTRPELQALAAERARSAAEVDVRRAEYVPSAFVQAGASYMNDLGPGVTATVGLTIPLWRTKLRAGVDEAKAGVGAADADLKAARLAISEEVEVAREEVIANHMRWKAIEEDILPRARRVVTATTGNFASGQVTMVTLLEAARDLLETRMTEVRSTVRLSIAWARLQRATGQLGR